MTDIPVGPETWGPGAKPDPLAGRMNDRPGSMAWWVVLQLGNVLVPLQRCQCSAG
jgi:hypothetical protein